ncbi:MAG: DUF5615 family PIN-like protein [Planctomycetes bacterium]|nr:DUF5615 family PIN-like protein [Planctomycetota bacterium]
MPPPPFARLLLDEHLHTRLAPVLRSRGYDVVTVSEAGRSGSSDEDNLRWAARGGRTIATFNAPDFVALHRSFLARGEDHAGIVLSPQIPFRTARDRLLRFLREQSADEMRNSLFWMRGDG